MKKKCLPIGTAFAFMMVALSALAQGDPRFPPVEPLSVSLPHFVLGSDEVIESFTCVVSVGSILRVNAPYLWEMELNNGLASRAELKAGAIEGEDEFANKDLRFFDNFVVIGKPRKSPGRIYTPFDVTVELSIVNNVDLNKKRKIDFSMKQLVIKPAKVSTEMWLGIQ
jgi:hypothetical protein